MGADFVTIDFSGMLTPEELSAVEAEANEWVWKNVQMCIRDSICPQDVLTRLSRRYRP